MPQTLIAGFCSFRNRPTPLSGAAGADADDEVGDPAVGLLPDLRPGLLVVRGGVRQVVVLVRLPCVRHLLLEPRRHRVVRPRVLGIDVGRADDHLGAERLERVHLLLRLLVGRREDAVVAFDDGGDREPHAGVARRALDDRAARLQQPRPLGVLDHPDRHAVLDRIAGVERLDLGEHRRLETPLVMRLIRTIGVWPMASRMLLAIRGVVTGELSQHFSALVEPHPTRSPSGWLCCRRDLTTLLGRRRRCSCRSSS